MFRIISKKRLQYLEDMNEVVGFLTHHNRNLIACCKELGMSDFEVFHYMVRKNREQQAKKKIVKLEDYR